MPQISADISENTKQLLERYARENGVKKAWLIESALQHHLRALRDLPADVIVRPRFVPTRDAAEKLVGELDNPAEPTAELIDLMRTDGD